MLIKWKYHCLIVFIIVKCFISNTTSWTHYEKSYKAGCKVEKSTQCEDLGEHAYKGQLVNDPAKGPRFYLEDLEPYNGETFDAGYEREKRHSLKKGSRGSTQNSKKQKSDESEEIEEEDDVEDEKEAGGEDDDDDDELLEEERYQTPKKKTFIEKKKVKQHKGEEETPDEDNEEEEDGCDVDESENVHAETVKQK